MKITRAFLYILMMFQIIGCASTFQGEYADPTEKEIVDDRWNETDARKTSEVLIQAMLGQPWLKRYVKLTGKDPFVIVDHVQNRTDEHLDTQSLVEAVRDQLIQSGQVRFVDGASREKILNEIRYQNESGMVSQSTAKRTGRQIGADFLLKGAVASQVHSMDDIKTVTYQTTFTLTDLETAEIVFSRKYDIKKRFRRSSYGW